MKPTVNNNFYIYQHVDPRTNLVRYIGKGKGRRAWDLNKRSARHKNWLKQLKSKGLKPVVELIEIDKTEEQAFELEMSWIKKFRKQGQPLTNLTDGGEGVSGRVLSEESRRKISRARKGKAFSDEHRRRLSDAHKGKTPNNFGKTPSEETKRKISEANKGKPAHNRRIVIGINLVTGEERAFESATAAASFVDVTHSLVSRCCRGGGLKKTKGWTFRYAENKP